MVEKTKKQKRGSISEVDISTILKRYPATTVLALLQEVAQVADVKIDWNELVKKTKTGISSAREYQMLWRHLAYRDALLERLDDGDQPLDDDSDLEHELEAFPTVSSEASTEAAAFVKVLITSGLLRDSSLPNGSAIEAPLTINIPNRQLTEDPSENSQLTNFMQGTNITIPVSVKKQPQNSGTSGEGLDANGSASGHVPARRKRKTWSREEDDKLKAAVEKCGEGNWANILKGYFKDERKASQLSQRWAIIRKRAGNTNVASGSQPSDGQLAAAHRAVSLALDNPRSGSSVGPQSHHPSQQDSGATVAQRPQIPGSSPQSRVTIVRPSAKSALSPVKLVKATAVAAGARIATALDAASLLKAAQAKNAVHIIPVGGGSLMKSSVAGNSNPLPSLHPNVHYIRTGMAVTPPPPRSTRPGVSQQAQGHIQSNISSTAPESNASSEAIHSATPTPIPQNELDVTTVADNAICSSGNAPRDQVQENRASSSGQTEEVQDGFSGEDAPKEQVKEGQASVLGNKLEELLEKDQVTSGLGDALDKQVPKDQNGLPG